MALELPTFTNQSPNTLTFNEVASDSDASPIARVKLKRRYVDSNTSLYDADWTTITGYLLEGGLGDINYGIDDQDFIQGVTKIGAVNLTFDNSERKFNDRADSTSSLWADSTTDYYIADSLIEIEMGYELATGTQYYPTNPYHSGLIRNDSIVYSLKDNTFRCSVVSKLEWLKSVNIYDTFSYKRVTGASAMSMTDNIYTYINNNAPSELSLTTVANFPRNDLSYENIEKTNENAYSFIESVARQTGSIFGINRSNEIYMTYFDNPYYQNTQTTFDTTSADVYYGFTATDTSYIADTSGNGYNLSITTAASGADQATLTTGKFATNSAYQFQISSANSSYIYSRDTSTTIDSFKTDYTVEMLFKFNEVGINNSITYLYAEDVYSKPTTSSQDHNINIYGLGFDGDGNFNFNVTSFTTARNKKYFIGEDQWYYMAITAPDTTGAVDQKVYMNGTLVHTGSIPSIGEGYISGYVVQSVTAVASLSFASPNGIWGDGSNLVFTYVDNIQVWTIAADTTSITLLSLNNASNPKGIRKVGDYFITALNSAVASYNLDIAGTFTLVHSLGGYSNFNLWSPTSSIFFGVGSTTVNSYALSANGSITAVDVLTVVTSAINSMADPLIYGNSNNYMYSQTGRATISAFSFEAAGTFSIIQSYDALTTTASIAGLWCDDDHVYVRHETSDNSYLTVHTISASGSLTQIQVIQSSDIGLSNNIWGDDNYIYNAWETYNREVDGKLVLAANNSSKLIGATTIYGDGTFLYSGDLRKVTISKIFKGFSSLISPNFKVNKSLDYTVDSYKVSNSVLSAGAIKENAALIFSNNFDWSVTSSYDFYNSGENKNILDVMSYDNGYKRIYNTVLAKKEQYNYISRFTYNISDSENYSTTSFAFRLGNEEFSATLWNETSVTELDVDNSNEFKNYINTTYEKLQCEVIGNNYFELTLNDVSREDAEKAWYKMESSENNPTDYVDSTFASAYPYGTFLLDNKESDYVFVNTASVEEWGTREYVLKDDDLITNDLSQTTVMANSILDNYAQPKTRMKIKCKFLEGDLDLFSRVTVHWTPDASDVGMKWDEDSWGDHWSMRSGNILWEEKDFWIIGINHSFKNQESTYTLREV